MKDDDSATRGRASLKQRSSIVPESSSHSHGTSTAEAGARSLRILIVIDSTRFGGAERQASALGLGLRHRHEVHFASLDSQPGGYLDEILDSGIAFKQFPRHGRFDPRPIGLLVRYIRDNRIDVIHTFLNMGSLYGLVAAKVTRRPVVCSPFRDAHPGSRKSEAIKRFIAHHADLSVANSRAGFDCRFEAWTDRFRVVYNGLDMDRFNLVDEDTADLVVEFSLERFDAIVGMVASLSQKKDHVLLLHVARKVLGHHPRTGFLIIGDGTERTGLEALALTLGIADNVVFTGYRQDADRFYPLLDLSILLTDTVHAHEGTPNAVIESMASGIPVIATRCGGTPETITDGEDGFLVPAGEVAATATVLRRLLDDPPLADRIGTAAAKSARRRFGMDRYIGDCEALYREVLGISQEHSTALDTSS